MNRNSNFLLSEEQLLKTFGSWINDSSNWRDFSSCTESGVSEPNRKKEEITKKNLSGIKVDQLASFSDSIESPYHGTISTGNLGLTKSDHLRILWKQGSGQINKVLS